jgi:hypothetical protein
MDMTESLEIIERIRYLDTLFSFVHFRQIGEAIMRSTAHLRKRIVVVEERLSERAEFHGVRSRSSSFGLNFRNY